MVAAWINAEMGVGPSIESGSHTCSGTCADLPMAPMNRQMQMKVIALTPSVPGQRESLRGDLRRGLEGVGVVQRSAAELRGVIHDAGDAQHEAKVADAVDQESLEVGEDRRRPLVPEADEQVGDDTHRFPAEEQLHEVVRHHQHEHREGEQRDVAEEAVVTIIFGHVADGVDVHAQRHEGHHAHHQCGELIDQEADLHADAVTDQPLVDGGVVGLGIVEEDRTPPRARTGQTTQRRRRW